MIISYILIFIGFVVLFSLWMNRHKQYNSSYNFRYPLGRIKDQKGFEKRVEINGYTFAFAAICMGVISTFFPGQEGRFFVLMWVLILTAGAIFVIGSYRFLK